MNRKLRVIECVAWDDGGNMSTFYFSRKGELERFKRDHVADYASWKTYARSYPDNSVGLALALNDALSTLHVNEH